MNVTDGRSVTMRGYLFCAKRFKKHKAEGWQRYYFAIDYGYFIMYKPVCNHICVAPNLTSRLVRENWKETLAHSVSEYQAPQWLGAIVCIRIYGDEGERKFRIPPSSSRESTTTRRMAFYVLQCPCVIPPIFSKQPRRNYIVVMECLASQETEPESNSLQELRIRMPQDVQSSLREKNFRCVDCNAIGTSYNNNRATKYPRYIFQNQNGQR